MSRWPSRLDSTKAAAQPWARVHHDGVHGLYAGPAKPGHSGPKKPGESPQETLPKV
jgi:hypothetical protein